MQGMLRVGKSRATRKAGFEENYLFQQSTYLDSVYIIGKVCVISGGV